MSQTSTMASAESTEASDLYGLPLDRFTADRDDLARRLKADGNDDEAAAVSKLRKPSLAAWALNQAARHHPDAVEVLLDSHRRLRKEGSKESIDEVSQQRSRAVTSITELAMSELDRKGSGQTRDRITRTLLAVATDPEAEADLMAGTLVREIEPSGAGWGEMALPEVSSEQRAKASDKAAERARARAQKLESDAVAAERRVETAKQALSEARRQAKQARAAADRAVREAEEAAGES